MSSVTAGVTCIVCLITGCAGRDNEPPQSDSTAARTTTDSTRALQSTPPTIQPNARRYRVKSAEVTMTSTSPVGEPMTITTVFDDYGARETTHQDIVATVQGKEQRIHNYTVIRDGWATLYDPKSRVGTRSPATSGFLSNIPDFDSLDARAKDGMRYRRLDTRTIAGRSCQGHAYVNDGLPIKVWLWEGIPLRSEIEIQTGSSIVSQATAIKTGISIPDSLFVVPADIAVTTVGDGSR